MIMQRGSSAVIVILILAVAVAAGAALFFLAGNEENSDVNEIAIPTNENQNEIEVNDQVNDPGNTEMDETSDAQDLEAVVIDIGGENFSFSQEEIRVQEGQEVTINFTSDEGIHDWVVDEFDAATNQIAAGETTSVTFVADRSGEFEYYCSVGDHRQMGMVGTLIVE